MKNIIVTLLFFNIFCQVQAQATQLLENDWYLEKLIIGGEEISPPYDSTVATIHFDSDFFNLEHTFCEEGFGVEINYIGDDTFENGDGGNVLLGTCAEQEVIIFGNNHYSIYHDDNFIAKNPFNYTFEEDGSIITLTVTNVDGDQGIYTNQLLGIEDAVFKTITYYPNPAQNIVTINSSVFIENVSIVMYDVTGKSVFNKSAMSFDTHSLDIASFTSGVYFLELKTAAGAKRIEKIIKF